MSGPTRVCRRVHILDVRELAGKSAEEFLLVHPILEGLVAVDEYDWDFIVELAAKVMVGINVDFLPGESTPARQLAEALLHHFAQVTSLA